MVRSAQPDFEQMYDACVRRDGACDGLFYICVRTTGVFCRPSCRARKPRRENVEFAPTAQQAMLAGFRACKVCRPTEPTGGHPEWVRRALDLLARAPGLRLRDGELARRGVDPVALRRYFKSSTGVTFQAYQRAQRLGAALKAVRQGAGASAAASRHGWRSASAFHQAFKGAFRVTPARFSGAAPLSASWIPTPLRPMLAVAGERGLMVLEFTDRRALEAELELVQKRLGRPILPGDNEHLAQVRRELDAYFAGALRCFGVALDPIGTPFQRRAWEVLRAIPYGGTISYGEQAQRMGNPGAVRAVGRANGQNPIAIIVPCHRVISADGTLCGYGGGLWRKQWLLDHERRTAGERAGLFDGAGAHVPVTP